MKYIIPAEKLEKLIFKYLDMQYGDLEKSYPEWDDDIDFLLIKPSSTGEVGKYGYFGLSKNTLFIYSKLVNEISSVFTANKLFTIMTIKKWFMKKYNIDKINDISLYHL